MRLTGTARSAQVEFRQSFDVGSVRLTERFVRGDVVTPEEQLRIQKVLDESFAALDPETLERTLACVLRRAETLVVIAHP